MTPRHTGEQELEPSEGGGQEEEEATAVTLYGEQLEEVTGFKYLGRMLRKDGEEMEEMMTRIGGARKAMAALVRPLHERVAATRKTKMAVFRAVTCAQLLYGAESWTPKEKEWDKLHTFEMQCLRRITGMRGKMTASGIRYPKNEEVIAEVERQLSKENKKYVSLRKIAERRRLVWWGKILRMGEGSFARKALLARIPQPAYVGWKSSGYLVPAAWASVAAAGLKETDLWHRSKWVKAGEQQPPSAATHPTSHPAPGWPSLAGLGQPLHASHRRAAAAWGRGAPAPPPRPTGP